MAQANIIAIDGPAASGKSTVAKKLADSMEYLYFDTGVMYRAVTWQALSMGVDVGDESAVTTLAESTSIDVRPPSIEDGRDYDVWVGGQDVTWEIRRPEVEVYVSVVSAYRGVRAALSAQQRRIGLRGKVVMAGRDIGTVVLPEADLKVYLDASVEERARRRFEEQKLRGVEVNYHEILESMQNRDRIDSTRQVAPLKPAEDAVIVSTDSLSIQQVLTVILDLVKELDQD